MQETVVRQDYLANNVFEGWLANPEDGIDSLVHMTGP
jgi:hypothetical protein